MCIKCNELNIILYVTYIQYNIEFVICMTIIETLLRVYISRKMYLKYYINIIQYYIENMLHIIIIIIICNIFSI